MANGASERPVRVQLTIALLLGLLLVSSGLYLWRRPARGLAETDASGASASASTADAAPPQVVDAGPPPIILSDARILGCHDRGPKVTSPEECDHLASIEQALSHAIEQSVACVPSSDPGGTIEYVADVSFSRHKLRINLPRSGRTFRDRKVINACGAAVREAMHALALDAIDHQHARYQIAIVATYRGKG